MLVAEKWALPALDGRPVGKVSMPWDDVVRASPNLGRAWRRFGSAAQPLPLLLAIAGVLHRYDTAPEAARREPDPARSITIALGPLGLHADPADVHFLPGDAARGSLPRAERSVVLAHRSGELGDVYLVVARRSPEGNLLEI